MQVILSETAYDALGYIPSPYLEHRQAQFVQEGVYMCMQLCKAMCINKCENQQPLLDIFLNSSQYFIFETKSLTLSPVLAKVVDQQAKRSILQFCQVLPQS